MDKVVWWHRTWVAVLASFLVAGLGSILAGRMVKGLALAWLSVLLPDAALPSVAWSIVVLCVVVAASMVEAWHDASVRNGTWER